MKQLDSTSLIERVRLHLSKLDKSKNKFAATGTDIGTTVQSAVSFLSAESDTSIAEDTYMTPYVQLQFVWRCPEKDDIAETREKLLKAGVSSSEPVDEGWGVLSSFQLPGGGKVGFYRPRHDRP